MASVAKSYTVFNGNHRKNSENKKKKTNQRTEKHSEQIDRRSAGSRLSGLALMLLMVSALCAGTRAHATTLIPFNAATTSDGYSYGFVDPASFGLTISRNFNLFQQASSSPLDNPATALLNVNRVSSVRCARASDQCNDQHQVFDVLWDVTFNANILSDPSQAQDLDLILVDSDPDPIFTGNVVRVDFESGLLEGQALQLQVAKLNKGNGYHFIDFALGRMLNGETKRIGFSYEVNSPLPPAGGGQIRFLFPLIVAGAFSTAAPVPEPGTAILLGLGLAALALRQSRAKA